jgi:acetyl-CoA carboxylase alpha subunit
VIAALTSDFTQWAIPAGGDPLRWPGHAHELTRDAARTGCEESVVVGDARIGGHPVVLVAFEFGYRGGTLGERAGAAIVAAVEQAITARCPLISVIASGGARVQEGMIALTQMQHIAAALARARAAGVPHLSVAGHPTSGGVWASLAAGADITLALTGAEISFAGSRLRPGVAPEAPFSAEAQLHAGAVDAVADTVGLAAMVASWVAMLTDALRTLPTPSPPPPAISRGPSTTAAWDSVMAARSPARPRAARYLDVLFERRLAISGDRVGGRDEGVICGLGQRAGRVTAYAAQTGSATRPSGFRTVTRLLRLAERLQVPVLTLIDTPGAADDPRAEGEGVGGTIAETLMAVSELRVPVTSILIGEGGSGGALALAAPNHLWVAPDSYFSVTAPESVAEILHRDRSRAPQVSAHLALRPSDLVRLGVARGILSTASQ